MVLLGLSNKVLSPVNFSILIALLAYRVGSGINLSKSPRKNSANNAEKHRSFVLAAKKKTLDESVEVSNPDKNEAAQTMPANLTYEKFKEPYEKLLVSHSLL
jgi:hypothetical protein